MIKKSLIVPLYINIFLVFTAISLVVPSLPLIIKDLNIDGDAFGILIAVFSLFQMIFSPIVGFFSDRYAKKHFLSIGLLLYIVSEFLFGIGMGFYTLLSSRILGGISAALIQTSVIGIIGDISDEANRDKNFGTFSAITSLGFIIGPGIGALFATFHLRLPYFIAMAIGIIMLIINLNLKIPHVQTLASKENKLATLSFKYLKLYLLPAMVILLLAFGLAAIEELYLLYLVDKADFTSFHIALAIIGGSLLGALTQYLVYPKISRHLHEFSIIIISSIYSIMVLCILLLLNSVIALVLISCVIFIGFDIIRPAITVYLSKIAKDKQGLAGSMNSTFTSLGTLIAPIIAGYFYVQNINAPVYIAILTIILTIIALIFLPKKE
ncbi:MFS transporter [Staphylococcus aureus]|uniref:MFS transporter n=1 Tax=Staphylococcus aureus TaxID=1280 RepID=UPI001BFE6EFA|nr:MFS transporter [Staphylococcus aureus]MBT8156495.1 MFS transporter [Staphylococcus aureus]MBU3046458.1 MFS transporter [Staphylococcus aureus]MBU6028294.1 MFS transporter [Staphylococcus aureus]MBU6043362.1 MFS transporter [Staphylococcus aureus]MBU6052837.1 MFS transporter [Staphylococcus aureus]